jgi:Zn-dependent peptidase ImmA (M78 family)
MASETLDAFTRRKIARIAEQSLQLAGAVNVLPTPIVDVQKAVGVRERVDMNKLPAAVAAKKPSAWSRILGAYLYDERTVFVDGDQPEERGFWTDAHETAHAMCDWHGQILRLDNEDTLFKQMHDAIEAEANFGAGHLIFQGGRFHKRALRDQVSMRTPIGLASSYGASRHATLHYYVEEHPYAVGLLVAGIYPYANNNANNTIPIWKSVESESFVTRYGRLSSLLPGGALSLGEGEGAPLAEIVREARLSVNPPSKIVTIPDKGGTRSDFVAEAFFNQHCHFVLVAEQKATRLGQRVRLAS